MRKRRASVLTLVGVLSALLLGLFPTAAFAASAEEIAISELKQQAAKVEAELTQTPRSEVLLAELTKTRVRTVEAMINYGEGTSKRGYAEIKAQMVDVDRAWSRYLKVAKKPHAELAELVAPMLFERAELAKGPKEAEKYVKAAAKAQRIVTEHRPSQESWTYLSYYELFAQHYGVANEEIAKALAKTKGASERAKLEKTFEEVEKNARQFGKELKPGK